MTPEEPAHPFERWEEAEALRLAAYALAEVVRVDIPKLTSDEHLLYLLDLLRVIDATVVYLRDVKADLSEYVTGLVPGREIAVQGIGNVKVNRGGKNRKAWDHDSLFSLVLARSRDERMVDEETGEYEDPASAFLRVLRDCMGTPGYWKLGDVKKGTGLRARGIEADEFCETEDQRNSVSLPADSKLYLDELDAPLPEVLG